MNAKIFLLLFTFIIVSLSAQDSTFVRFFTLSGGNWNFFDNETEAANVFEDYNGNLCLQTCGTFHTQPPELAIPQSPILRCNRNGTLHDTIFGPTDLEGNLIYHQYEAIMKDNSGGYLALSRNLSGFIRLDAEYHFVGLFPLFSSDDFQLRVRSVLSCTDGLIISGWEGVTLPPKTRPNIKLQFQI